MNAVTDRELQLTPGRWCKVWIGAFTASPGTPPEGAEYVICEIQQCDNGAGQIYVWPRFTRDFDRVGSSGRYVFISSVMGAWPHECGRAHPQPNCVCAACLVARQQAKTDAAKKTIAAEDRLKAAAPELLSACEAALEQGQHADGCGWWNIPVAEMTDSPQSIALQEKACNCYLHAVRYAISKATGGAA
jgi:hypothetical protein